jgi:Txe/YoeB family toxin of Txe-Axe toxin-antitoxin module
MELVWSRRASKGLAVLPTKARAALMDRLKAIAADPFAKHANVEPLKGEQDAVAARREVYR